MKMTRPLDLSAQSSPQCLCGETNTWTRCSSTSHPTTTPFSFAAFAIVEVVLVEVVVGFSLVDLVPILARLGDVWRIFG